MLTEIWKIHTYEFIKSTIEEAARLIGEEDQFAVMAYSQSQGRGKYNRPWISPPGNLYTTLAFKPAQPCQTWGQISFVAALAAGEVIQHYVTEDRNGQKITYKWPNDILISGHKVAGILLEVVDSSWLTVSFGINLQTSPEGLSYACTSIKKEGRNVSSPEEALSLLIRHFTAKMNFFEKNGFSEIKKEWLKKAACLGKDIEVTLQKQGIVEKIKGTFTDLDEEGRLLLELPDKVIKKISSGDVFLL